MRLAVPWVGRALAAAIGGELAPVRPAGEHHAASTAQQAAQPESTRYADLRRRWRQQRGRIPCNDLLDRGGRPCLGTAARHAHDGGELVNWLETRSALES